VSPTRAEVLAFINSRSRGITTVELARQLGGTVYGVSSILSKLRDYGYIDGEPCKSGEGHRHNAYLWVPKKMEAAE
jgi:predicted transcriptional regulator